MKFIKGLLKFLLVFILLVALLIAGVRLYSVLRARGSSTTAEQLSAGTMHFSVNAPAEALIVLGAGVYRDGSLSPILKNRLDTAIQIYGTGAVQSILATGDHRVGEYDEVDHMVAYLTANGIPAEAIRFDYDGYSTYESMMRAVQEFGIRSAIVVTQDYHLPRAMMVGRLYGIDVMGVPAPEAGGREGQLMRELREWPACVKDLVFSLLKIQYKKFG